MSDADDAAVWEAIGGDPDELPPGPSSVELNGAETLTELKDEFEAELNRLRREHQRELVKLRQRITALEDGDDPRGRVRDSMTTLQKYATMVEDGVADSIGVTDRRAVAIYRHWDQLKEPLGNGHAGVTTRRNSNKKNQPSQFRVELQQILDDDLEWEQVYRAMKAVAELSGGEPEHDEYGRTKIVGGVFEYHERTSPDNTDDTVYKVLLET